MSTQTIISVEEYLSTSYRPDCDYVDGELLARNVGEWDHSRLQTLLSGYFLAHEKEWRILVVVEQRVQVKATRFRVPDIAVLLGRPDGPIIRKPPFLCIELLSPSDRIQQMQTRIDDYLSFGVRYVWLIYPDTRRAFVYTTHGVTEIKDGILSTENPEIRVNLFALD